MDYIDEETQKNFAAVRTAPAAKSFSFSLYLYLYLKFLSLFLSKLFTKAPPAHK